MTDCENISFNQYLLLRDTTALYLEKVFRHKWKIFGLQTNHKSKQGVAKFFIDISHHAEIDEGQSSIGRLEKVPSVGICARHPQHENDWSGGSNNK